MATFRGPREAFGRPGLEPRWTQGCKEGVGTAYSADSRVWFTISHPPGVAAERGRWPRSIRSVPDGRARGELSHSQRSGDGSGAREEASGYSPSTLAANIAALCCAAGFARERGDAATARYLEEYADFLECHLEAWTVTTEGTLHPDISRHFIRIHPVTVEDRRPDEDPNRGTLAIANRPPGARWAFAAKEIVDAGFLELVRYGIRRPDDPLIVDSLRVVDRELKVDTPVGPCWRRYNHDGYGQRDDGGPYEGSGRGRAWPLLTGERAHYDLALGRDIGPLIRAMEGFASPTGLLPEQVWDQPDQPDVHMHRGKPTGAAMPLMWAHAEYIKLLRSVRDGKIFDHIPAVADRYLTARLPVDERGCRDSTESAGATALSR